MDNGNGEHPPQPNQLALAPNVIVTPENYWKNLQHIQLAKQRLAQYEQELQTGYQRYLTEEDELKKRIEAGRQAEQMLAQMQGAGNAAAAGSSHARPPPYASSSTVPGSASSSASNLQTFPPANTYYNPQTQPNATATRQNNPTMVAAYGQFTSPPQPYQQQAAQYGQGWPQYVNNVGNQQAQHTQHVGHAQGQGGSMQSQQRVPVASPPSVAYGTGQTQAATVGSSERQPPANQPGQMSTPDDLKRATALYASQTRQNDQQASATSAATVYKNVYVLLKELRPEMVDYIIFCALDSLKYKLPSGAIQGQIAFQKVRDQLPPHSVQQLSQIGNYVARQLEVLEPAAIKAVVVRIKQSILQHAGLQWQSQQAAASAQGTAGPSSQSSTIQLQPAGTSNGSATSNTAHLSAPAAARPLPSKPASPPSLASALGNKAGVKVERPSLPQKTAHPSLSSSAGPSMGTPIQLQDIPGSSPSRRTVFPLARPPAPVAPSQNTPHPPSASSSGQAAASSNADRPKSPWTPAKADKARLAQAIMRSLGRPSASSQPQSPARPPPSVSQDSVAEDSAANKRKRMPSVTESSTPKKQKVEVEEIATDGAFELAVWQQQEGNDRVSVATDETGSPQKAGPSYPANEPVQMQGASEGHSPHNSEAEVGVGGFSGAPPLGEGSFAPPAPFPSVDDYLGMPISQPSQPPADVDTRAPDVERNEEIACPPVQEVPSSPLRTLSVGTPPPTSRTASPLATVEPPLSSHPKTPVMEPRPSIAKTPLFFPSPASEHGYDVDASTVEEELDPAAVFASAFSANADLVTSPRRIPTRAKGKAKMVVEDSEDEDSRSASSKPKVQKKQRVVSSGSDLESEQAKQKQRSESIQRGDSDMEVLDGLLPPKRSASRKTSRPIVNQAYVLAPQMPKWAKRLREKEKEAERLKTKRKVRKMSTPETVPESVDELAMDDEPDQARLQEEQAQQEVVRLAVTRLHESRCLWRGCDAILNSTESLTRHVHVHAEENENAGALTCGWRGCSRVFSSRVVLTHHLVRHASATLFCVFEGCEKFFATPADLFRHHKNGRHRTEQLKPLAAPHKPEVLPAIPPLPADMPSYMQVPCPVSRHPVSKVVHQWLSAKVLEDISSFRFAGRRMHHNAPSRSSQRLADKIATVEKEGNTPAAKIELLRRLNDDEYEQVGNGRELKPAMRCADIPSSKVTRLLENGYVMFPPPGWTWEEEEEDDSVEIKSESDQIDFLHGDQGPNDGLDVGERQDTLVSGHAVLDGQEGKASQSSAKGSDARLEVATSTAAAGGDHVAGDAAGGESTIRMRPSALPLPGWEVLPGASGESRQLSSTQPGKSSECVMS